MGDEAGGKLARLLTECGSSGEGQMVIEGIEKVKADIVDLGEQYKSVIYPVGAHQSVAGSVEHFGCPQHGRHVIIAACSFLVSLKFTTTAKEDRSKHIGGGQKKRRQKFD